MQLLSGRENAAISLKFGYFGLGMGGGSIANECANIRTNIKNNMSPYTGVVVNSNEVDLAKIPNSTNVKKFQLKGYEKGAGRDMEVGEQAFLTHVDSITKLVNEYLSDRDFVWITCGLGGGTGAGSILEAVKLLGRNGFRNKMGLILTLPRDQEGKKVIENAVNRLQFITKAMNGLGSIILVDNNMLFEKYLEENENAHIEEYLSYSNRFIAETIHEMNLVTASFKPLGGQHFDSSEFLNAISQSGIISISKTMLKESSVDVENAGTYLPAIRTSIENGILSNGYQYNTARRAAVSMIARPGTAERIFTMSFTKKIEDVLDELCPLAEERPVSAYVSEASKEQQKQSDVYVYTIIAGLSLPKRVSDLIKKYNELNEKELDREEDEVFQALNSIKIPKKTAKQVDTDFDELFGTSEVAATKSNNKDEDFDPFK